MSAPSVTAPSRALARLDAAIAAAGAPAQAAHLRAERACLLARQGHRDQANAQIAELRLLPATPALTAWLCLAEGLVDHYSQLGGSAFDRIRRAHALSVAARERSLIALAAAWLALLTYVRHDYASMGRYLVEALLESGDDHHATRARASLVAADTYHYAGRLDLAQPWYRRTHAHATAEGDDAMISALMHNRAWYAGSQARIDELFSPAGGDPQARRQTLLAAESSGAFDQHVGSASLASSLPLLRAQLLLIQGEPAQALALFDEHLAGAMTEGLQRLKAVFFADRAWCLWTLGRADDARADARVAQDEIAAHTEIDVDDLAMVHGRLAQVLRALGDDAGAGRHGLLAAEALAAYRDDQRRALEALETALARVTP